MSEFKVDGNKVRGVVKETVTILGKERFLPIEIVFGLAEILGRILAEICHTTDEADQVYRLIQGHIMRTVEAVTQQKAQSATRQ